MISKIVIIGEKNAGKSSLFNMLIKKHQSTVIDFYGYTRDYNSECLKLNNKYYDLIDTAGIGDETTYLDYITLKFTWNVIKKSDIIIYMIDIKNYNKFLNFNLIKILNNLKKKIFLVFNKIDLLNNVDLNIFNKLNYIKFKFLISVKDNIGINDILDEIIKFKNENTQINNYQKVFNISIIGKKNIGKSSLINVLSKSNRMIVYDYFGTTKDNIKTSINTENFNLTFIDTPGIKKHSCITNIYKILSLKTLESIKNSDLVIFLLNSIDLITNQDNFILKYIIEQKKNFLLLFNKTDLLKKNQLINIDLKLKNTLFIKNNFFYNFISAKYNYGIKQTFENILYLKNYQKKFLSKIDLDEKLEKLNLNHCKIKLNNIDPLSFTIFYKATLNKNNKRYITGYLINHLNLLNIPIIIIFKKIK
jgi:GTPase